MNSIKNFLKKSVLIAVATASLVTVANFGNANNVANAAKYDAWTNPQKDYGNQATVIASKSKTGNNIAVTNPDYLTPGSMNQKYDRHGVKYFYLDGLKVRLETNGVLTLQQSIPKSWLNYTYQHGGFKVTHPELMLVMNSDFVIYPTKYTDNYKNPFNNIKKLYKDYYHVNIDNLLTYTRPKNWESKYRTHGVNPKSYMIKGYSTSGLNHTEWSKQQVVNKINSLHHISYKDQRRWSPKNDFSTATKY